MPVDISQKGKGALPDNLFGKYQNRVVFGDVILPYTFSLRDKVELFKKKDQGRSLSCGPQAFLRYAQVLQFLATGKIEELSPHFMYPFVKAPSGGSTAQDNINFLMAQGATTESLVSSYKQGLPPDEGFMSDASQITPAIKQEALTRLFSSPLTFSSRDVDQVKKAIFLGNGSVIALLGRDEDWTHPGGVIAVPQKIGAFWGHFIVLIGWLHINNQLYFEFVNSWGEDWGDKGYGYLPATYLINGFGYNENTLAKKPVAPPVFNHAFYINLEYGNVLDEVVWLQLALQKLGYFPADRVPSKYYLEITRQAVEKFQKATGVWNSLIAWYDQSKYVGPKTRAMLNTLLTK